MSEYITGARITMACVVLLVIAWLVLCFLMKRVTDIVFESYDVILESYVDDLPRRVVTKHHIVKDSQRVPLHYGTNDFFITITDGVLRKHTHAEVAKLTSVLHHSNSICFLRIQVTVTGNRKIRLTRFSQTNLSKQNVRLNWTKAEG